MVEINLRTISVKNPDTGLYEPLVSLRGDSVFIRYSANADGSNFTENWTKGQKYIGLATAAVAPTLVSDYEWILFSGEVSDQCLTEDEAKELYAEKSIEKYILNIDYSTELGFDTTEIVFED